MASEETIKMLEEFLDELITEIERLDSQIIDEVSSDRDAAYADQFKRLEELRTIAKTIIEGVKDDE